MQSCFLAMCDYDLLAFAYGRLGVVFYSDEVEAMAGG